MGGAGGATAGIAVSVVTAPASGATTTMAGAASGMDGAVSLALAPCHPAAKARMRGEAAKASIN